MNKQIVIDRVEAASVILDFLTKDSACHAAEGDTQQGGRGALTEAGSHGHAAPLLPLPCSSRSPADSGSRNLSCHSAQDERVTRTRGGPTVPADAGPTASSALHS